MQPTDPKDTLPLAGQTPASVLASEDVSAASLSAAYLNSILPAISSAYDLDVWPLLAQSGISKEQLAQSDYLISFYQVGAFFLSVLQECRDEGVGLVVGSAVQAKSYQVLGYAILSSQNLDEAIDRLIRYEKLVGQLGSTVFVPAGEGGNSVDICKLVWQCPFEAVWVRFLKEAAIAGWVTYSLSQVQVENAEFTVYFDHPASSIPIERYQKVFGDRIIFDSDWCGVAFDKALLTLPFTQADPGLNAMMDRQAAVLLEMFDSKLNLVNSTREQIASRLPSGDPILDEVAEALSLTARVLQNRLKESGTTFKEVVDEVRKQLSLSYLSEENVPLIDVAFLLGFSEQSSFSRAFKRWMGKSPMEYRKMS